jgi:hypothetical protein
MFLFDRIRHNDQEEIQILSFLWLIKLTAFAVLTTDVLHIVIVNGFFESLDTRFIR